MPNLRYEAFGISGRFQSKELAVNISAIGIEATVQPRNSLLEAFERAYTLMMFNCRKGECGLCQVDIVALKGTPWINVMFSSEGQKDG